METSFLAAMCRLAIRQHRFIVERWLYQHQIRQASRFRNEPGRCEGVRLRVWRRLTVAVPQLVFFLPVSALAWYGGVAP